MTGNWQKQSGHICENDVTMYWKCYPETFQEVFRKKGVWKVAVFKPFLLNLEFLKNAEEIIVLEVCPSVGCREAFELNDWASQ